MTANSPLFTVLTWGCQMNEDDSNQISGLLMQMGYQPAESIEQADVIMLNTCSVRAKPEQKVKSKLGELRELKEENPDLIIGVCGCMAQRQGADIRKYAPHVDMVIGTAQIERIPEMICEVIRSRQALSALELPRAAKDEANVPVRVANSSHKALKAFVPITYGCDNFCAYCIVPYVRGKERSRPLGEIVEEVKRLVDSGTKEVTLLGQNVNSYASPEPSADFPDLLAAVNDVPGLERIRFTTSHPKDMSDRLIQAMADLPKVCEHIHLPIQSGDNDTLKRMRRGYTVEHYKERVAALREAIPGVSITTDILLGFPGETDQEFENTLRTIEEIRYDAAFMFAFSPIARTVAAEMPDQVPYKVKNERLRQVIALQNRITIEKNIGLIGQVFEVMVEGLSPKNPKRLTGLTRQNKTVNFPKADIQAGEIINIRAVEGHLYGFVGELLDK
ncbi:MAG TPA: tRNA (N6-isopentenyl adenosine(37)-C2)-methylthiotransferase MiaB [Armatimonadota bacterium]|nr:tRNA (N6-isopentenyl adenosine(37)-C2)-methylthiotransferase MiaB [Armatimonadota bacterium]